MPRPLVTDSKFLFSIDFLQLEGHSGPHLATATVPRLATCLFIGQVTIRLFKEKLRGHTNMHCKNPMEFNVVTSYKIIVHSLLQIKHVQPWTLPKNSHITEGNY